MKLYNYVRIQFALMQRHQQRLVNANWNMTSEECNNHAYFTYVIISNRLFHKEINTTLYDQFNILKYQQMVFIPDLLINPHVLRGLYISIYKMMITKLTLLSFSFHGIFS